MGITINGKSSIEPRMHANEREYFSFTSFMISKFFIRVDSGLLCMFFKGFMLNGFRNKRC